jgi:hypothetical protein
MIFVVFSLILSCSKSSNNSVRIIDFTNKLNEQELERELEREFDKISWIKKLKNKGDKILLSKQELTDTVEMILSYKEKVMKIYVTPQTVAVEEFKNDKYDKEKMINILQDTKDWTHVYNAISKMSKSDDTLKGSKDLFVNFLYNRCYGLIEIMVKEKAISKLKLKTSDIKFKYAMKRSNYYQEYLGDPIRKLEGVDFIKLLKTLSYVADNLEYDKEESAEKTKQRYFVNIFEGLMCEDGKTILNTRNYEIACEELIDIVGNEELLYFDHFDHLGYNRKNNIDYFLKVLHDDKLYSDKIKTFISSDNFMKSVKDKYKNNDQQTAIEIMLDIIKKANSGTDKSFWYHSLKEN